MVTGLVNVADGTTLDITELPIGTWTDDYKAFLLSLVTADTQNGNGPFIKVR